MHTTRTIVIIPIYNCQKQIIRVLSEFTSTLLEQLEQIHIIDNCSTDGSVEAATTYIKKSNLQKKIKVFVNHKNYNLGGTQKIGFLHAIENSDKFDYLAILHGDNQALNSDLALMLSTISQNNHLDCIMGARFHPRSKLSGYSKLRIFGNIAICIVYSLALRSIILDLGSGLNLYKVSSLKRLNFLDCSSDLTFNMSLLIKIIHSKMKIKYMPITWREEDQVSNAKIFNVGFKSLILLFKSLVGVKPIIPNTSKFETSEVN